MTAITSPGLCRGLACLAMMVGLALPSGRAVQARPVPATFHIPPLRVSLASPFADCIPVDLELQTEQSSFLNSEVEPRLAAGPRPAGSSGGSLIGVWQQDRWRTGGARGLVAAYSADGGRTWGTSPLPFTACSTGGLQADAASDPWISIGPDGTAYAVGLTLAVGPDGIDRGVAGATSTDGGRTWHNVQRIAADTPTVISDKESVTADPTHPGVAYAIWDRTGHYRGQYEQAAWFARTADGGKTWSAPVLLSSTHGRTISHQIAVDRHSGTLYDVFSRESATANISCDPDRQDCSNAEAEGEIVVIRSADRGKTWSAPVVVSKYRAIGAGRIVGTQVRTGTRVPEIAIDQRDGAVYVAWEESRYHKGNFDGVSLSLSRDGGTHWSAPAQVRAPAGVPAVTPSIAVAANGWIGVTYYILQKPKARTPYLATSFWFTDSPSGGHRFGAPLRVAGPFNMLNAPDANGFFVGDYEGLAAVGNDFGSLFSRVNDGSLTNRTDIYFASIAR